MNCTICAFGTTQPERVTVTPERDDAIVLTKDGLAHVRQNYGERYFDSLTTDPLLALAERAFAQGAELAIVQFPTQPIAA